MPSASKSRSPVEVETVRDEGQVQDRDREADDAGDDDGETGEEEYEIEKILYHEEGVYTPGEMAYFVSWVGYGTEDNSWVKEEDIMAEDMLRDYWKNQKVVQRVRKISKAADRTWNQIAAAHASSSSAKQAERKRARGSQDTPSGDAQKRSKQGGRPGRESLRRGARTTAGEDVTPGADEEEDEEARLRAESRRKYEGLSDWESVVESVDTVERTDEGRLVAYVRFKDGGRYSYDTAVVNRRCPLKIIDLYESKLRWLPPSREQPPVPDGQEERNKEPTASDAAPAGRAASKEGGARDSEGASRPSPSTSGQGSVKALNANGDQATTEATGATDAQNAVPAEDSVSRERSQGSADPIAVASSKEDREAAAAATAAAAAGPRPTDNATEQEGNAGVADDASVSDKGMSSGAVTAAEGSSTTGDADSAAAHEAASLVGKSATAGDDSEDVNMADAAV